MRQLELIFTGVVWTGVFAVLAYYRFGALSSDRRAVEQRQRKVATAALPVEEVGRLGEETESAARSAVRTESR